MDIIIQSLGFKASTELEAFINEKVNNLKSADNVIRATVTLFQGSDNNPENNYCEIRLEIPGNDHFVKKSSPVFEQSVVEAVDTMQKMINKAKDKLASRKHDNNALIEDMGG